MSRNLPAPFVAAIASDSPTLVDLVAFHFTNDSPANIVRVTSCPWDVDYDSQTWQASPNLVAIGNASESADLRVGTVPFVFSAANQLWPAIFLNNNYTDAKVEWYRAALDPDNNHAVLGALLMYEGRVDGPSIDDAGASSQIEIDVASHWANFQALSGRKTNDNDQQRFFPGDLGCEFASHTVKDIRWGFR